MYEIYCKLRDQKGAKDADVAKATGITKSTFSDWKSGRSNPKGEKLSKIASYFGVSVEYLSGNLDENEQLPIYYFNKETADIAQEIFENKELRILFDAARDIEPEDLKVIRDTVFALKRKERRKYSDD